MIRDDDLTPLADAIRAHLPCLWHLKRPARIDHQGGRCGRKRGLVNDDGLATRLALPGNAQMRSTSTSIAALRCQLSMLRKVAGATNAVASPRMASTTIISSRVKPRSRIHALPRAAQP